ncbi:MAG TPA: hypothetical protein VKT78_16120 [Fimbriimonadaceae bacterium]|nr:hypothetical protein [Fimbriimonadaceae bacterium]
MDLPPVIPELGGDPLLDRLAGFLKERKIVESGTLIVLAAATLHAVAARNFRRVDHWEVLPGGWLPPPVPGKGTEAGEPVGNLIEALEGGGWKSVGKARSFSAKLSDQSGCRVDFTVRRVHRERRHALTLELWGNWTPESVKDIEGSVKTRLPIAQSTMTKFQYA